MRLKVEPYFIFFFPSFSRGPHCVALYAFSGEQTGELSIAEGDRIELLERLDADWLKGRLGGSEGIFPAGFVNVVEDLPPPGPKKTEPKVVGGAKPPAAATKSPPGM